MILPETLKQVLLASKFVTEAEFNAAAKTASELGKPITDILVFRGHLTEDVLGQLIAEYYGVPFVKLRHKVIPTEVLQSIPEEAARSFRVIPVAKQGTELQIAMENPRDLEAIEFIKRKTGSSIKTVFATPQDIGKALSLYKKNIKSVFADIINENVGKATPGVTESSASDLPVIKILDALLELAAADGASDVHLETFEEDFLVRFRVDGILRDIITLPHNIQPALIARIKILSGLKIDEHRIPQDGRFKLKIGDELIAFRVSIIPSFYAENVVLRLLAESTRPLSLEELGLVGRQLELLKNNIKKPNGMVLVTGPTGSGKTTTLYSVLNMLNTPQVNICTIEDPIEYGIRRVNQIQINPAAGLTFAAGLRALLRHDPNIIMVGEIRDGETADMAIHSSLTGHLVLSTLHTNSAAGAIPRFLDMGAEGFLVASTINLVMAQRLVRRICSACMEEQTIKPELRTYVQERLGRNITQQKCYYGKGCPECNNSGYRGRVGAYELLEVTNEIRQLIIKHVSAEEIEKKAVEQGMEKLLDDGFNKVSAGITTIDEIIRIARE